MKNEDSKSNVVAIDKAKDSSGEPSQLDLETKKKTKAKKSKGPKKPVPKNLITLSDRELRFVESGKDFIKILGKKKLDMQRIVDTVEYERELKYLQIELNKLQSDIVKNNRRVVIIFEGRDAAGKGGTIRRFTQHLNPRDIQVVALPKPNETELGQWYFQRYVTRLPAPGNIVFFDRSWYNRAVVEPVMGFCDADEYENFMRQVPEFEKMLRDDGIELVKFWFSITKEQQEKRFKARRKNPLKQWKMSPVDEKAQGLWDKYTKYKESMFTRTHSSYNPWVIIQADNKRKARTESIRYLLSKLSYEGKGDAGVSLHVNTKIVQKYKPKKKFSS